MEAVINKLNTPQVTLLHATPLSVCARAIRTCWNSHDKSDSVDGVCGEVDKALINRVGNKNKHASTLEHISYSFEIEGISRGCLQELARHRIASLSVKSSRYTLKKDFTIGNPFRLDGITDISYLTMLAKYVVLPTREAIIREIVKSLENLRVLVCIGASNDELKYAIPECFKTALVWTINARSLQNFLTLRTSKSAWSEIRNLALEIFKNIPDEHKYLFEHCIQE